MPVKRWKWLIALCFPLALKVGDVCVINLSAQNETTPVNLVRLPMQVGDWQGRQVEVPKSEVSGLGREAVVQRNYTNSQGRLITVNYIYSNRREGLHLPENCLVSQGWTIVRQATTDVKYGRAQERTATANFVVGATPKKHALVELYLFVNADKTATDWGKQYLNMIKYGRAGGKMTCLLLLTSPVRKSEQYDTTQRMMEQFMAQVLPAVHESLGGRG
jgi:EpsI family protein